MGIAERNMKEDITCWAVTGDDGYGGWSFATPIKFTGRWVEKQELFKDSRGVERLSEAVAYLPQDIAIGDYVAQGDQTATLNPTTLAVAQQVQQYSKITDLRLMQSVRKVFL